MSSASLEPEEIIDSCFSNHSFKAATIGAECSSSSSKTDRGRSAAHRRVDGIKCRDLPDRSFRGRGFRAAHELYEATAQMAPAMDQHPRSLGPLDTLEPIVPLVAVALQEATAEAMQEAFGMFAAP